jgi:hypothetical protein
MCMLKRLIYQYKLMAYAVRNGISDMPISLIEGCYKRDVFNG